MSERVILHCDLNNFFASVETLYKPELKNVPMAVCGSTEERHGIVLAKNEKAKKYGIKTAEAVWQALSKCPSLVCVPPNHDRYMYHSKIVREIYEKYTDMVEPFGIDECWLDVTGSTHLFGSGEKIAHEIRRRVKKETGLTISVGVSFNKIFAKLGSDLKKPDAVTVIPKESFKEQIWHLPCEDMFGIGRATKEKLNNLGIITIGDVANADEELMRIVFGKVGSYLIRDASGLDMSPVLKKGQMPPAKSYGKSVTCLRDLVNERDVSSVFLYLSEKISSLLRENDCFASVIQITVRDDGLVTREKQMSLVQPTRIVEMIYSTAMTLFHECWSWCRNIRSLGIRACDLVGKDGNFQYSLLYSPQRYEKFERLEEKIELIKKKYGEDAIFRGGTMTAPVSQQKHITFNSAREI